ncbi:hypothetical protein VTO73DRAFT_2782 [Trametes versicolor]
MSSSVSQLPNETLHAIFDKLAPGALTAVLRASHRFRLVAERVLYAHISIVEALPRAAPTAQFTACCARTLLARPHLAEGVRRLAVRWQTDAGPRDDYVTAAAPVLALLHAALRTLGHLEHLDLALGLAGGTLDARAVLDGCAFPFLRRRSGGPCGCAALEQLRLPDCYEGLALPPGALPALAAFRGSAVAAASVLPGRPVQLLGLVGHEFITERDLARIAQASAPVRFLDLSMMSVTPILLRDISRHLTEVEVLKVKLALRHTLHHALSGISLLAGLSPVLGAFPGLHQLDLSPTSVDGVARGNALEESSLCTTWARACPALRSVVFPSRTEWRREGAEDVWVAAPGAATVWTRY